LLRTRLLSAAVLLPIVVYCVYQGGVLFGVLVVVWLSVAGIEFWRLSSSKRFHPALAFVLGMIWLFLLDAQFAKVDLLGPGLAALVLVSLGWQVFHRRETPVADWALAVAGGLYLGVCGACWIKLRQLEPDGLWWMLTILPSIILADTGAYFVGRAWGRHLLAPALSPGKTWEGYAGGVFTGGLLTGLLGVLWHRVAGAGTVSGFDGLIFGLIISIVAPLGDLVVSMLKREADVKDTSHIIPGHGGALDRIDSVLWTGVIGYYLVLWSMSA